MRLMAKKEEAGVFTKAKDIYAKAVCNCDRWRNIVNCTVPRKYNVGASKEIDGEDLRGLMQLLSMGKGGGAKVDVDSEGNILWRKPATEISYGGGVGKIGRIDEDKPCCFKEVHVFNKLYSTTRSASNIALNIRNLAY